MYNLKKVLFGALSFVGVSLALAMFLSSCKNDSSATILGDWKTRAEFQGVARSEAVSFVIGDSAYVGTGFDGTNRLNDFWQYQPALDYWVQKADFSGAPRQSAVAFTLNNKGYVGTGFDGVNNLGDFYKYDPAANSWVAVAPFGGTPRYDAVAFSVLNKGYVATGYDGNFRGDMWSYSDSTNTWNQEVGMGGANSKRSGAVAFVYNNKAFIVTGNNNGVTSTINDLWMFDPTANPTWTAKRPIYNFSTETYDDAYTDITRNNAVAFVMGAYAYLTTGNNGSVMTSTWQYDIVNDLWFSKTAFEGVAREGAVAFSVDGEGYVGTGRASNTPYDDFYYFYPNLAYVAGD